MSMPVNERKSRKDIAAGHIPPYRGQTVVSNSTQRNRRTSSNSPFAAMNSDRKRLTITTGTEPECGSSTHLRFDLFEAIFSENFPSLLAADGLMNSWDRVLYYKCCLLVSARLRCPNGANSRSLADTSTEPSELSTFHKPHSAASVTRFPPALERASSARRLPSYRPRPLTRWRQDRRAGNGILIEGSPSGEMHHVAIRLVNGQTGHLLDVAGHAGIIGADLPCLEGTGDVLFLSARRAPAFEFYLALPMSLSTSRFRARTPGLPMTTAAANFPATGVIPSVNAMRPFDAMVKCETTTSGKSSNAP
jgi:hypothetical protein